MLTRRTATAADIDAMWALRTRAVRSSCAAHYAPHVIAQWSAAAPPASYARLVAAGAAVIVNDGGAMLGFGVLNAELGEVDAVFVDPAAGRRGIGAMLLRALEDMAAGAGCSGLHLSASLNAVPFYEASGYRQVRAEPRPHRSGITLDSVYMEKSLTPAASNARVPTS